MIFRPVVLAIALVLAAPIHAAEEEAEEEEVGPLAGNIRFGFLSTTGNTETTTMNTSAEATYTLDQLEAALRDAERGGRDGKVLLTPNGPVT